MSIAVIIFDPVVFRLQFPEYSDPTLYPDAMLLMYWDMATCYISDLDYGWLAGNCRKLALNQMTAHLLYLAAKATKGKTGSIVQGAAVDKVSVTLVPPLIKSDFNFWLNQSPYGQALLSLLDVNSVGGFYIPGNAPYSC